MLYPHLLALHNTVRWIVLVAALVAVGVAASGWNGTKPVVPAFRRWTIIFVVAMDLQFLIGLTLYVAVSPLTQLAFQNMAMAMKDHELRFFTVEHTTYMLIALVAVHMGAVLSRKGRTDRVKYRGATIAYGVALLLMLAGIPWWRPLLRFAG